MARRVRAKIERDLASEDAAAEALRAEVLPRLRVAVETARADGLCTSVVLFGSYAWGRPGERSDIDLLVEGAPDPFVLAGRISAEVGLEVHAIARERAPATLVDRAVAEGRPL